MIMIIIMALKLVLISLINAETSSLGDNAVMQWEIEQQRRVCLVA